MLLFERRAPRARIGLKGPLGAQWLAEQGIALPLQPNTWTESAGPVAVAAAPGVAAESAVAVARSVDAAPTIAAALLVARLGASEFFLEAGGGAADGAARGGAIVAGMQVSGRPGGGTPVDDGDVEREAVRRIGAAVQAGLPGIYPVLREDAAFLLSGDGALDVLAQVCNVNFAALDLGKRPVIMTLVIGVSVLIVPQSVDGGVQYRIWCDPTFGSYVDEAVGKVVIDCGGSHGEMSA